MLDRFLSKKAKSDIDILNNKAIYFLRSIGNYVGNTTATFNIPSDMQASGAIFLLGANNAYGVGGVWVLKTQKSGGKKISITNLVTSSHITIEAVSGSDNSFKVITQNASGSLYLTRIA